MRKKTLSFFVMCLLALATVLPIVIVLVNSSSTPQERCDCANPTINFTSAFTNDTSDSGICGNPIILPNGNLAMYFYDVTNAFFFRIYSPNGTIVSSTPIDGTGSGQWTYGFCDSSVQSIVMVGDFVYLVQDIFEPTSLGLMRFFLNGTLDTTVGLNGYLLFTPGLNGVEFTNVGAVASSADAIFIGGATINATQEYGFITKFFVPSLTLDLNFGENGDAYFPIMSPCGDLYGFVDPYGTMLYDASTSRILFVPRSVIYAVNSETGMLDTTFGPGTGCFGVPSIRGQYGSILLSTGESIWGAFSQNSATSASVSKVNVDGTNYTSQTPVTAGRGVRQRVAPFCSQKFAELEITRQNNPPPWDLKVSIRSIDTLESVAETSSIQVSYLPNTLIYVESVNSFFIFNTENGSVDFPTIQVQCPI